MLTDDNYIAKLDETRKSNPPDVMDTPEMESSSGIKDWEACRLCQTEAKREKRRNERAQKNKDRQDRSVLTLAFTFEVRE